MVKAADKAARKPTRAELVGWKRLGALVRTTRTELGFTNTERFAAQCDVAQRVISDLETGNRTNFKTATLSKVEAALGWPAGTAVQIVSDTEFMPPPAAVQSQLLFRQPDFNTDPVLVEVSAVQRLTADLMELAAPPTTAGRKKSDDDVTRLAAAALPLCLPYLTRLVEDNCLPGKQLHPSVSPHYEAFLTLLKAFAPDDTTGRYVQWLAGDLPEASGQTVELYMKRYAESRRNPGLKRATRRRPSQLPPDAQS